MNVILFYDSIGVDFMSVVAADAGAVIQQQTYLRHDNGAAVSVSVNGMFQFICYQVKAAMYCFSVILT